MKRRPIFLNLFQISSPVPAVVSILHRISGVVLFLIIPLLLWLLDASLTSSLAFEKVQSYFQSPFCKLFTLLLLSPVFYHFWAGIRHLCMDVGVLGDSLRAGRFTAYSVLVLTVLTLLAAGVWLW